MEDEQTQIEDPKPKPKFNPNQPFKPAVNGQKPSFDPTASFEPLKKKDGIEPPPLVSPDSSKDSSNGSPSPSQSGLGLAEMISKSIARPTPGSRFRSRARQEEENNAPLKTTPSGELAAEPTIASGAAGEDVKQNEISNENPFKERIQAEEYLNQRLAEQKAKLRKKPEAATNQAESLFRKPEDINGQPLDQFDLNDIGDYLEGKRDQQAFQVYQKDRNEKDAVSKYGITEEGALNFAASQGDKDAINIKGQPLVSRKKFDEVVGTKMMEYLYSPNVMKMASENPELAQQWNERNEKLYDDYPTLAKRIVAQKIGQEREDRGMGGLLVDIPTRKGFGIGSYKTEGGRGGGDNVNEQDGGVDALVEDMHTKGDLSDKEVEIYNKEIAPKLGVGRSIGRGVGNIFAPAVTNDAPIPTTDYAGTLGESYKNTVRGIAHSVEDIVNANPLNPIKFDEKARVNDIMNREYSTAMIEPKGILSQAASTSGSLTGFLIPMILGGEAKIPEVISSGLTFEGINHDTALREFPDSPRKQLAYTALATAGDMWLTKLIPTKEAGEGLRKSLGGEIKKAIEDFADNKLTAQAAKERLIDKATSLIQKAAPDLIKGNAQTAATLSGFGLFHNGLNAAFGGRDVTFDEAANEAVQTFKIGLLASTPLTAAGMYGKYDKSTAKSLREAANNKDFYNKMIFDQIYLNPGSIEPKLQAIANLERASAVNEDLKNSNLSEKQKDKYLLHDVVESIWTRKAETTTDTNLKDQYLQKAEDAKSIKDQIWKGTKDEDIIPDSHKEFLEEKDKIEKEIISLEKDHDFEQQKLGLKLAGLKKETDLDEEGKKKNEIEQQQVQQKMQDLADKHDTKINKLKEERAALVKERNSTLSPDDIVGRIKQAATSSVAKGFKGNEKVEEQMTEQSIDAPLATMESLSGDRELVTDLIAKNSKEDIEAARKKWMKVDDEKADDNVKLLEEGLEKQKTKNENDTQATLQNLSTSNKKEGTQTPEEKITESKSPSPVSGDWVSGAEGVAAVANEPVDFYKPTDKDNFDTAKAAIFKNEQDKFYAKDANGNPITKKENGITKEFFDTHDEAKKVVEEHFSSPSPVPEGGQIPEGLVGKLIKKEKLTAEEQKYFDDNKKQVTIAVGDEVMRQIEANKGKTNKAADQVKEVSDINSALKQYEDSGDVHELATNIESLAEDNPKLQDALKYFRDELEYDRSISGRHDMEMVEKNFVQKVKEAQSVPEGGGEVPVKAHEERGFNPEVDTDVTGKEEKIPQEQQPEKPRIRVTADQLKAMQPPKPESANTKAYVEYPPTSLNYTGTGKLETEFQLNERQETERKRDIYTIKEADDLLDKGWDVQKKIDDIESGESVGLSDAEYVNMTRYAAELADRLRSIKGKKGAEYNETLNELQRVVNAANISGKEEGRALGIRGRFKTVAEGSYEEFMLNEKAANGDAPLTDRQIDIANKEYSDLEAKKTKLENEIKAYEDKAAAFKAEEAVKKIRKEVSKDPRRKKEQLETERENLIEKIKEKWKNAGKRDGNTLQSSLPGLTQLGTKAKQIIEVAPDVLKLARNLVEDGIISLQEIKRIIGDTIDMDERDVHDILAGEYAQPRATKRETAIQLENVRIEAKLINKLERLMSGTEPKNEKKLQKRNKEIEDLKKQIKDFRDATREQNKFYGESYAGNARLENLEDELQRLRDRIPKEEKEKVERELSPREKELRDQITEEKQKIKEEGGLPGDDLKRLQAYGKALDAKTKKLQEKLDKGDFEPEEKRTPILDDYKLREKYPEDFKKVQQSFDDYVEVKRNTALRLAKQMYENKSDAEKTADVLLKVAGIPRTIMASFDFSAPLRQGLVASVNHPVMASQALKFMFQAAKDEKIYNRWLADVHKDPDFKVAEKIKIGITDPTSLHLQQQEEAFQGAQYAEQIPVIGAGVKASERAYVGYLNHLRWNLFKMYSERFKDQGKTFENNPKLYKGLASMINSESGRGNMAAFERYSPALNFFLFSSKLIASRLNMLGLTDIPNIAVRGATFGKRGLDYGFYTKLPKELRVEAAKDMLRFVAVGTATLLLFKHAFGAEVETDPRSSDFGKIKYGNTRWDIWGGFQPYARVITQMLTGQRKQTGGEKVYDLSKKGEDNLSPLEGLARGKFSPIVSGSIDAIKGTNAAGQDVTVPQVLLQRVVPLLGQDIYSGMQDQGMKAFFTVGIPSAFGVGVNTYQPNKTHKRHR